jgi:hypothetical protein
VECLKRNKNGKYIENGDECWYLKWWINGKLHRTDGPALIWNSGCQEWYLNGERHRTDGPAVIWPNGSQEWYLNGERVTEAEVMKNKEVKDEL